MNKVILSGRLTKDPEIHYTQSAEPMPIAKYIVAVNRKFKKQGEPDADFIPCVAFNKQAEFAQKHLSKGKMVNISGRMQVRSYNTDSNEIRWSTEVVIEDQEFGESKRAEDERTGQAAPPPNNYYGGYSQNGAPTQNPAYAPQPPAPPQYQPTYPPQNGQPPAPPAQYGQYANQGNGGLDPYANTGYPPNPNYRAA